MSTPSKTKTTDKESREDLATFERLPEKSKDLLKLKESEEKSTGPGQVELTQKIKAKGRQTQP